jgi:dipeptidyl-peptidase-4
MPDPLQDYPRQVARTRQFQLGVPRAFEVSPDGARVVFLRSRGGDDAVSCLWVLDVATGDERCVVDPRELALGADDEELTLAERARRERAREQSSGVTAFATDRDVRRAVLTISGRMFLADLVASSVRELSAPGAVDDPRLDPAGERIAFVVDGDLYVRDLEGGVRKLAGEEGPAISWGLAEFAAAEEMRRFRGHWWSPDGRLLAAARVDETPVRTWYIADQTDPASVPRAVRFPQTGTDDAIVSLHVFDLESGDQADVTWDADAFPYLGRLHWSESGPPIAEVVSRDQRRARVFEFDPATGATTTVRDHEDDAWVDLVETAPRRLDDGRVVEVVADRAADTYRLTVDGESVTPSGLQVRSVLEVGGDVLLQASQDDPSEVHLWRWSAADGATRLSDEAGLHSGASGGGVLVRSSASLGWPGVRTEVVRDGAAVAEIASLAEIPVVDPKPRLLELGDRRMRAALLLPGGREPDGPLPVVMDPYGGPGGARVLQSSRLFLTPQWIADHGFAVIVADGRGVDGRGPAWDREMKFDFTISLDDQVDALQAAAKEFGFLDTSRVAIRGWSFGGYLSAMAVLRRPDVFHAAVVGAPVTDQRYYDTYYTERFLGHPDEHPDVYDRNSILAEAPGLERPILLIHGLADDNVYVTHTLRFSAALFEAGRRHELVLIPNATHLSRSEAVTEQILRVQIDFLKRTIGD